MIAVALLGLGVLAIANPALTGMQDATGDLEVTAQEIDVDAVSLQAFGQEIPELNYVAGVTRPEEMTDGDRAIFDAAIDEGFSLEPGEQEELEQYLAATGYVMHGGVLLRPAFDEDRQALFYQEVEGTVVVDVDGLTEDEIDVYTAAVAGENPEVGENASALTAYDLVDDADVYYALEFEETSEEDALHLTVTEQTKEDVLMTLSSVGELQDFPETVRGAVATALEGEVGVVEVEDEQMLQQRQMELQELVLIRHEGAFYQLGAATGEPHLTELLEPYNYALMLSGVLLILASGVYARKVYVEEKERENQVRHVVKTEESTAEEDPEEGDGDEREAGTEAPDEDDAEAEDGEPGNS